MSAVLPLREYRLLRQLFDQLVGTDDPFERIVRQKLRNTRLLVPGEVDTDLVRLGSRVRFKVVDRKEEERTIVASGVYVPDGRYLTLESPLAVAMLGHQTGDVLNVEWREECPEELTIMDVCNQSGGRFPLESVVVPFRRRLPERATADDNDDGPSAA